MFVIVKRGSISCQTVTKCCGLYAAGICDSSAAKNGGSSKNEGGGDEPPNKCKPSSPTVYDCRKYGHNLPCDSVIPYFETLPYFPTGIFRCTAGEVLGRGAKKCSYYQNPEYFSFHHMTFYDMHMLLRCYRIPSAKTGRKK